MAPVAASARTCVLLDWQTGALLPANIVLSAFAALQFVPSAGPRHTRQVATSMCVGSSGSRVHTAGAFSADPSPLTCALPITGSKSAGPHDAPNAHAWIDTPAPDVANHVPAFAPQPAAVEPPGPFSSNCHAPSLPPAVPLAPIPAISWFA